MFPLCSDEGMRIAMASCSALAKRSKRSLSVALALGLMLAPESARAIPDDAWCRSVGGILSVHQPDREGLVGTAIGQHDWVRVRRLFSLDYPLPANLRGPDRARALHEFRSVQLIAASARGDLPAVNRLLAAGADPNAQGEIDYIATPLALAALCDRPAVALRLIRGGARVNHRFRYANDMAVHEGTTALMWASMGGSLSVTQLLLNRGARRDLRDSFLMHGNPPRAPGGTALEYSLLTDFPNGRAIQQLLRAQPRRH